MTSLHGRTGILGGTLNPIHLGHVAAAEAACAALSLEQVLLVPSHQPPHRPAQPLASAYHRFAMVALAVADHPRLAASDLELQLPGPSYTAVTLRRLLDEGHRALQLFFIIGTDAFAEIASWYDYPAVLDLAHFVVVSRPGESLDALVERLPGLATRMRKVDGPADVVETGRGCQVFLLQAATPDVSSTSVRDHAARGGSLAGLVAPEVERHIVRHGLYGWPNIASGSGLA
jgi:nicotinate-nucleotide adenylyltransferase